MSEEQGEPLFNDDPSRMTFGRRFARLFSGSGCYNPSGNKTSEGDDEENDSGVTPPSLDKAWEYFEHIVLPRCFVENHHASTKIVPQDNGDFDDNEYNDEDDSTLLKKNLIRAEPGEFEKETKLYPIFGTNDEDMGDFGIGVALYFNTLKWLALITFIAGCINIPNMLYFATEAYEGSNADTDARALVKLGLKGSALCTNVSWEPCPDCDQSFFKGFPGTTDRIAEGVDNNGNVLQFIKKNNCNVNTMFGVLTFTTLIVVVAAIYYMISTQTKKIISLDEKQATSSDYSIEIKNPPNDARDPEEWKEFFESKFDGAVVRSCTIALDNEVLVKALIHRRRLILKLTNMLPTQDFDTDDIATLVTKCPPTPIWKKIICCASEPEAIYASIQQQDLLIEELSANEYKVASVFVTFETEQSQRDVLDALYLPLVCPPEVDEEYHFNGVTLKIRITEEPDSVRWEDLNVSFWRRVLEICLTTLISFALIIGGAYVITQARKQSPGLSSTVITIINQFTPRIVRLLTSYESHPNQSAFSASTYIKVTVFRWTNTAIIMTINTPFTDTLQSGSFLLDSVLTMFLFDLILPPVLSLLDIFGNLARHVFGPRKQSQRLMNLSFKAGTYDIGSMYTNVTRIFFLTVFYCTIFPGGFFFAAAIFTISYWLERFVILRSRGQSAPVSATVSKFSNTFFLISLVIYAVMAAYAYAQFPYDNACDSGVSVDGYEGEYTLKLDDGTKTTTEVKEDGMLHNFCDQDLMKAFKFPPTAAQQSDGNEWMNDSQETFSAMYSWTMIVVCFFVLFTIVLMTFNKVIKSLFCRGFVGDGEPVTDRFTDVPEISGYIPQVQVAGYEFPFLLCDIDEIATDLLGWDDPYHSYDHWNLIYDIPAVAAKKREHRELTCDDAYVGDETEESPEDNTSKDLYLFSTVHDWDTSSE